MKWTDDANQMTVEQLQYIVDNKKRVEDQSKLLNVLSIYDAVKAKKIILTNNQKKFIGSIYNALNSN